MFFLAAATSVEWIFRTGSAVPRHEWYIYRAADWDLCFASHAVCDLVFKEGLNENRTHEPFDSTHFCLCAEVRQWGKSRLAGESIQMKVSVAFDLIYSSDPSVAVATSV